MRCNSRTISLTWVGASPRPPAALRGRNSLHSLLATARGPAVQVWTKGFVSLCGWQIIPHSFKLVQITDWGFSLSFRMFLLAKAGAAVHSSLQSRESPEVTSIINIAWHLTGKDSSRMKTIH